MSFKLSYIIGNKVVQEWYFPSRALANWKKKNLKDSGRFNLGKFQIEETK
jgi:K+-transporting ATPase c subunit